MREAIKEYIEYNEEEKKQLWKTATFVFDTNVFLNLYRYSTKTREQLIEAFEKLDTRIWMPYQVAKEYCKNRYKVIGEANNRCSKIQSDANKDINEWLKELRVEGDDKDAEKLRGYIEKWLHEKKEKNYSTFNLMNDEVFEKLLDIFDKKTGAPFDDTQREEIEKEGGNRYSHQIPPGYRDSAKSENCYGDLFVWKEIIAYAKNNKVDIIFVTSDQKPDWWNIVDGKTVGPRVELRKEFYEEARKKFHMYTMASFLSFYGEQKGKAIDKTTIDEVSMVAPIESDNELEMAEKPLFTDDSTKEKIMELDRQREQLKKNRDFLEEEIAILQDKVRRMMEQALRCEISKYERKLLDKTRQDLVNHTDQLHFLEKEIEETDYKRKFLESFYRSYNQGGVWQTQIGEGK